VLIVLACAGGEARQRRISPHESTTGTVDGADLTITYGRPSMRGRTIFGSLVRYGQVWTPGADEATELTTSKPLQIAGLPVPAGSYTLWMIPSENEWTLIVNKRTGVFHLYYPADEDLGRVPLRKRSVDSPVDQLTFTITKNRSEPGGLITMTWETTEVSAPFSVVE
jgi:hypothetical protein